MALAQFSFQRDYLAGQEGRSEGARVPWGEKPRKVGSGPRHPKSCRVGRRGWGREDRVRAGGYAGGEAGLGRCASGDLHPHSPLPVPACLPSPPGVQSSSSLPFLPPCLSFPASLFPPGPSSPAASPPSPRSARPREPISVGGGRRPEPRIRVLGPFRAGAAGPAGFSTSPFSSSVHG